MKNNEDNNTTSTIPNHFEFQKKIKKSIDKKKISKKSNKCRCLSNKEDNLVCNRNCSCFKNSLKCSLKCQCKGKCSNGGKPMSESLFFKVWRNKVIRNEIIGEKNLEIIREKDKFKKELIEILNQYNLKYNEIDINQYTKMYNVVASSTKLPRNIKSNYNNNNNNNNNNNEITLENVKNIYLNIEKEKREIYFKQEFEKYISTPENLTNYINYWRTSEKSEIIKIYVNTLLPKEQLKLPSIEVLVKEEIKCIDKIFEIIKRIYREQGIKYNDILNLNIQRFTNFINSFGLSSTSSTSSNNNNQPNQFYKWVGIEYQKELISKSERLNKALNEIGFCGSKKSEIQDEIEKYIRTFRPNEIISKQVWSFDDIINYEKRIIEIENEKEKRRKLLLDHFNNNNLIFNQDSPMVDKFINSNLPPKLGRTNNNEEKEEEEEVLLYNPLISINQVIEYEKKNKNL